MGQRPKLDKTVFHAALRRIQTGLSGDRFGGLATLRAAWSSARRTGTVRFASAILLLLVSVLFGGASQSNGLAQTIVELASLPLLFVATYRILVDGPPPRTKFALALLGATIAIPVLQLVPLPATLWSSIPCQVPAARALQVARVTPGFRPYSLTPEETWRGLLALVPPVAMFLGTLQIASPQKRLMAGCWLSLAVLSILIGALQLFGGKNSELYFYEITNVGSPVGLFANRNHQAVFVVSLIPLAGALAAPLRHKANDRQTFVAILSALYIPIAIVGVAVIPSRAGIILLGITLFVSIVAEYRSSYPQLGWNRFPFRIGAPSAAALIAVLLFGLAPILDRFSATANQEERFSNWPIIVRAASDCMPFGSGIGSFDTIYRTVEPLAQVGPVYFNHAHNDYLEVSLETGWAGMIVLALFIAWSIWRTATISSTKTKYEGLSVSVASSVLILILLAHSTVDYPLRTEALAVLFAFACANVARSARDEMPACEG